MTGAICAVGGITAERSLYSIAASAGLASNLQLVLDARAYQSYPGSGQTWSDVSGNGNNFYLGTTSGSDATDPTFHGTAGNLSASEYWTSDGGDLFTLAVAKASFWDTLHKTGGKATALALVYMDMTAIPNLSSDKFVLVGTDSSTVGYTAEIIMSHNDNVSTYDLQIYALANDSTFNENANAVIYSSTTALAAGYHVIGISTDWSTGVGFLDGTGTSASVAGNGFGTDAAGTPRIGASNTQSVTAIPAHSFRLAGLLFWNTNLSSANMTSFYNALKANCSDLSLP